MKKVLWITLIFGSTLFILSRQTELPQEPKQLPRPEIVQPPFIPLPTPPKPTLPPEPRKAQISVKIPGYLPYSQLVTQMNVWKKEAPDFVDVGTYGQSSQGIDIYYIRVTNKLSVQPKKRVLITACIHGNEPLANSVVVGYIGTLLASYDNPQVKKILDTRDLYFVPVFSPDSFPHSRHVDGVDPNRNFPGPRNPDRRSVPPVAAVQKFFLQHHFSAVISGHTSGRVLLTPYGDKYDLCPNENDYKRITGQMAFMSGYQVERACQMYSSPIYGTEVDWYYRQGAFAIVMEFGTNQRIPSMKDTQIEFDRTYRAFLYFLEEAPNVNVYPGYELAVAA